MCVYCATYSSCPVLHSFAAVSDFYSPLLCARYLLLSDVCLSVTFVYFIKMAKDIVKILYLPGSPVILVS